MAGGQLERIKSVRYFAVFTCLIAFSSGCRSLPEVHLGECSDMSYGGFSEKFRFEIPGVLRYRYMLHWNEKELICNGVTQVADGGGVNIAGFGNSGITMYSARWSDGEFEILKNNVRMPDAVLERSILNNLLLLYRRIPSEGDCIRHNIDDESLWLRTENTWGEGVGCFVLDKGVCGWSEIANGKAIFHAWVTERKGRFPAGITIENYKDGFRAEVSFLAGPEE